MVIPFLSVARPIPSPDVLGGQAQAGRGIWYGSGISRYVIPPCQSVVDTLPVVDIRLQGVNGFAPTCFGAAPGRVRPNLRRVRTGQEAGLCFRALAVPRPPGLNCAATRPNPATAAASVLSAPTKRFSTLVAPFFFLPGRAASNRYLSGNDQPLLPALVHCHNGDAAAQRTVVMSQQNAA